MSDKERAIAALDKAGYRFAKGIKVYVGPIGSPIVGVEEKYFEMTGPIADLPAIISPGFTVEQAKAADNLANVIGTITFTGNGADGATIHKDDLLKLTIALAEYREARGEAVQHGG